MLKFSLNHMTTPSLSTRELCALASRLGCGGIELRNDLGRTRFDTESPANLARWADHGNLEIHSVSEVKAFDDFSSATLDAAVKLMDQATACGAKAITLIPKVGGRPVPADGLTNAILALQPELDKRGLIGMIEPIGFAASSLRDKASLVALLVTLKANGTFKLVHDTFHHFLAGGGPVFAEHTGLVHVSGVAEPAKTPETMLDADRILLDAHDRLGNLAQLTSLRKDGFEGPISIEAFSPTVHALTDPETALSRSIDFIRTAFAASRTPEIVMN